MKKKLFIILSKMAISIGSIFLWMYLFNIGLGLTNAADDFLVVLGFIVAALVSIGLIVGNIALWEKEFRSLIKSKKENK